MKTITMMIGLPRSGKSTWIRENRANEVVISADDIRWLIYNQRFWQEGEHLVWSIREIMLKNLLQQGVDVIIDETNITKKRRKPIIELAKKYGYKVIGMQTNTDFNICVERAVREDREELTEVIKRMHEQFEQPKISEGFVEIKLIKSDV